jgi:hypothetical protein
LAPSRILRSLSPGVGENIEMIATESQQRINVVARTLVENAPKRDEGRYKKRMMRRDPEQRCIVDAVKKLFVCCKLGADLQPREEVLLRDLFLLSENFELVLE